MQLTIYIKKNMIIRSTVVFGEKSLTDPSQMDLTYYSGLELNKISKIRVKDISYVSFKIIIISYE